MNRNLLLAALGLSFGSVCCAQAPADVPVPPSVATQVSVGMQASVGMQGTSEIVFRLPFEPTGRMQCLDLPTLRKKWPELAIGRMFEALELDRIVAQRMAASDREREVEQQLRSAARQTKLELTPQIVSLVMRTGFDPLGPWHRLDEIERIDAVIVKAGNFGRRIITNRVAPEAVARWEARLAADSEWLRRVGWFDVRDIAGEGGATGSSVHLSPQLREQALAKANPQYADSRLWMLRRGRTFVFGSDEHEEYGSFEVEAEPRPAGLYLDFQCAALVDELQRAPAQQQLLAGLESLQITVLPDGDQLQEQIELKVAASPDGRSLLDLVAGTNPCIAQALPDGAILQLRADLKMEQLATLATDAFGLEAALLTTVVPMLDGRVAFGLTAPQAGGLIPRIYLTLGVAQPKELDGFLDGLMALADDGRKVTYGGVECTVMPLLGLPQGIQPTFCRIADRLHVAESPLSMRAFLKAQASGATAMVVADALPPQLTHGKQLVGADVRCDLAQLYRTFYDLWLPLFQLQNGLSIEFDDLPDPDDVDEHIGALHGSIGRADDRLTVRHVGPIGGPLVGAYLMFVGTMLPSMEGTSSSMLRRALAEQKLAKVWEILQQFEQRHQRRPRDLVELFVAGALPDDALLMPDDDAPEVLELPGKRRVSVSFRYFPEPVSVRSFVTNSGAFLLQCRASGAGRYALDDRGRVRQLWGADAQKPIDSF